MQACGTAAGESPGPHRRQQDSPIDISSSSAPCVFRPHLFFRNILPILCGPVVADDLTGNGPVPEAKALACSIWPSQGELPTPVLTSRQKISVVYECFRVRAWTLLRNIISFSTPTATPGSYRPAGDYMCNIHTYSTSIVHQSARLASAVSMQDRKHTQQE